MKIVIFAGGLGTRLWPVSRKKSPKQFEKIIGDKSTLQLTVDRFLPVTDYHNFYVSTNIKHVGIITGQLPNIPKAQIIGEPEVRDFGTAIGMMCALLSKESPNEPILLAASDFLIKNEKTLHHLVKKGEKLLLKNPNQLIYIADTPRFPNTNIGWAKLGKQINDKVWGFEGFKYRPTKDEAEKYIKEKTYVWNAGHYMTTPAFLVKKFSELKPETTSGFEKLKNAYNTVLFEDILNVEYPKFEKMHFDTTIAEKIPLNECLILKDDIGWSDVGTWESLKEALQQSEEDTVVLGKALINETQDSLVYNYTDKTVVLVGLNGIVVIETPDVALITSKGSMNKIKKLVEQLTNIDLEDLS